AVAPWPGPAGWSSWRRRVSRAARLGSGVAEADRGELRRGEHREDAVDAALGVDREAGDLPRREARRVLAVLADQRGQPVDHRRARGEDARTLAQDADEEPEHAVAADHRLARCEVLAAAVGERDHGRRE